MRRLASRLTVLASIFALAGCGEDADGSDAASVGGGSSEAPSVTPRDLVGTWKSVACGAESESTSSLLTFQFSEARWSVDVEVFGGQGCAAAMKGFTIHMEGPYELVAPSPAVEGARMGNFTAETREITPTAGGVPILQQQCPSYAWTADTAQDVAKEGCVSVHPASECPAEYDIVSLVDEALYFGDRSHSLCAEENRPTKLGKIGLTRSAN